MTSLSVYGKEKSLDCLDPMAQGKQPHSDAPGSAGEHTGKCVLLATPFRTPLAVKQQVGYMPDTIGFYEYMTAYENLDYTARFLGLDAKQRKQRITASLTKMRLSSRMNDKVRTFSHGMKRRLGLAELLVNPRSPFLMSRRRGWTRRVLLSSSP